MNRHALLRCVLIGLLLAAGAMAGPLDPRGRVHIPIGIPNTLDTLKTFVEPEGCFSPGVGSYGVYFWLFDRNAQRLTAPTMDGVEVKHGLEQGAPLPWSLWCAGDVEVTTRLAHVERESPAGRVHVVAAKVELWNTADRPRQVTLWVGLRGLGPAGWPVCKVECTGDALLVADRPAIVACQPSSLAVARDLVVDIAELQRGAVVGGREARSSSGFAVGLLAFDADLPPAATKTFRLICPVLPGRRAVGHQWDGTSPWAQFDLAELNSAEGGALQPDPGLDYYRKLSADALFAEARDYWRRFYGRFAARTPEPDWDDALRAIPAHAALAMNEGAPDVAVVNYNVFNRDGVYVANIMQKCGRFDLSAAAIDYFLRHPFNGRVQPEADNPGQILWIMGEHWRFTRDAEWLRRVYPAVRKLAALVRYYRTAPGPHWVGMTSLDFGDALPSQARKELKPGACDGRHPEYTEAFDCAGLRAAALLAEAAGEPADAAACRQLAEDLLRKYDERFGARLAKDYGSYCVLWPCRLYPCGAGKAHAAFRSVGEQRPGGWRYFPLANAHQGLLAGNRAAGHGTLTRHLYHEQMQDWFAFDEGGKSGSGGWRRLRTTWNGDVAMPHGWAIAELWLLLRDCLVHEDGERLVLLAGAPPEWFDAKHPLSIEHWPTHFGPCSWTLSATPTGAKLTLAGAAAPPGGYVLRLPAELPTGKIVADGRPVAPTGGNLLLPRETRQVEIEFAPPGTQRQGRMASRIRPRRCAATTPGGATAFRGLKPHG